MSKAVSIFFSAPEFDNDTDYLVEVPYSLDEILSPWTEQMNETTDMDSFTLNAESTATHQTVVKNSFIEQNIQNKIQ